MESSIWVPPPPPPPAAGVPLASANEISKHPPYAEMIYRAIEALKEKDGSTKTAIGNYIQKAYTDLPPAHPTLLTHHLKRLKDTGLLIMLNKSYKLPSSLPNPDTNQNAPPRSGFPKKRGRPPNPKHQLQATVIPFADPSLASPPLPVGSPRPRKNSASALPPHEVASVASSLIVPGRPQKLAVRGRPKKPAVGRPKGTTSANIAQRIANENLRRKLEYFQSKVKESLDVLKPYFDHASPVSAITAIQDLEVVATSDLKAPLRDVSSQQIPQQLPLQEQLPPQPQITYQQQHLQTQLQQLFQFQQHTSFPS